LTERVEGAPQIGVVAGVAALSASHQSYAAVKLSEDTFAIIAKRRAYLLVLKIDLKKQKWKLDFLLM